MEGRRYYFWIVARDENGKTFLIFGSEKSSEDARQKGLEMLQGTDFQIRRLPTRDEQTASRMLKGGRLERGDGLQKSTQRLGHDKSLRRLRRNAQRQRYP